MHVSAHFTCNLTILVLGVSLVLALVWVMLLRRSLRRERRRQFFPFLGMYFDDGLMGFYLVNESQHPARSVVIEDIPVTVDYGFKKHLLLKFEAIDLLKPGETMKLDYRVWEGDAPFAEGVSEDLAGQLTASLQEVRIHYRNLSRAGFRAVLSKQGKRLVIDRIIPDKQDN